jgi:HEPN domain-containing protein
MSTVRHRLMLQESETRLASAKLLRDAEDDSDSAYLLELLAFELLLKLVTERSTGSPAPTHHLYERIWDSLSASTQTDLLRLAGERVGPSGLTFNVRAVLQDLSSNFVQLRYPFERYSQMTETEYSRVGASWIANGANTFEAHFRYHPEELFGLTVALQTLSK